MGPVLLIILVVAAVVPPTQYVRRRGWSAAYAIPRAASSGW